MFLWIDFLFPFSADSLKEANYVLETIGSMNWLSVCPRKQYPGVLADIYLSWAIVEVAADTRKMSFRCSRLCGAASDAVDAVSSAIP